MKKKFLIKLFSAIAIITNLSSVYATENNSANTDVSVKTVEAADEYNKNNDNNASDIDIKINELNNSISAEAYAVVDSSTGELIIGKNEDKVMYPASLTKIVTSLLLIESGKLNDEFVVSKDAAAIGEASIYATEGEKLTGKDLLYAMMLQSANDACYVVAEGVSGTAENFYSLMTSRAHELGATSSNFMSANGLHHEEHYTTARDLALITKEALSHEEFRTAIKETSYELTRETENTMKSITNKNRMLFSYKPEYNETVIGGKTAFTTPAGNCLMEVAEKDGMEIIVITLKSSNIYPDTNKLINFTFDNYEATEITGTSFTHEYKGVDISLYSKNPITYVAPIGSDTVKVKTEVNLLSDKLETIDMNEKIGVVDIFVNGKLFKSESLYASEEYDFTSNVSFAFLRNIILLSIFLILLKFIISLIKWRKIQTKGYLKNSKFY